MDNFIRMITILAVLVKYWDGAESYNSENNKINSGMSNLETVKYTNNFKYMFYRYLSASL